MRRATTVGHAAVLAALLLGASGCAAAAQRPAATGGLASGASGGASGGLQETCMGGEFLVVLAPLLLLASPFLLVYAVVGTPVRVLARLRR